MAEGLVRIGIGRKLQVKPVTNLRNERGQYTAAGVKDQLQANRILAANLQAQVVQRMTNHIEAGGRINRSDASTGHLVNVTADPGNVRYTKDIVQVGIPSFLDKSAAKYWRTFEEGSAAVWSHPFVGTHLFGMAGTGFPTKHGEYPGLRTVDEHFTLGTNKAGRELGRIFVVQHEIAPANIYRAVAADNRELILANSMQWAQRVLNKALEEVVVAGPPEGAGSSSQQWGR